MSRRLLIVRPGALGDAILTLPLLAAASKRYDKITIIGKPSSFAWMRERPEIELLDIDSRRTSGLFTNSHPWPFETYHDWTARLYVGGALGKRLEQSCYKQGMVTHRIMPPRTLEGLTHKPSSNKIVHAQDHASHAAYRLLHELPYPTSETQQTFMRSQSAAATARDGSIILHPGSGGLKKVWPVEQYVDLANALQTHGHHVRIIFGPVELERGIDEAFQAFECISGLHLSETITHLSKAGGFVGNDSGLSHFASYFCPTLTLFGPTSPFVWSPIGPHNVSMWGRDAFLTSLDVMSVLGQIEEQLIA